MKKLIVISAILILGLTAKAETSSDYYRYVGGYFYTSLTPYGTWIEIGNGVIAWRPTVLVRNWAPYRLGRWVWTDYGWYWDSYEPFGHIVFHYGRWYFDDYYGWIWIPDYEWAPAWVEWRYDDDYIGWAPLHPYAVFSVSFGIRYTYDYVIPVVHWQFVSYKHFCHPKIYNYYIPERHKFRIYEKTKYRNNYSYYNGRVRNEGVDFDFIRKRSGQKIAKRDLIATDNPRDFENVKRRDDDRIRTFFADRNEIERDREAIRDVKVERNDRRPKIEMDKVELAEVKRSRTIDSNESRDRSRIDSQDRIDSREEKERQRNDSGKRDEMKKVDDNNRTIERERTRNNDIQYNERSRDTEKNSNDQRNREIRINRNESRETERSFDTRKNDRQINEKRNEINQNNQYDNRTTDRQRTESRTYKMDGSESKIKVESNRNDNQRNINRDQTNRNKKERTR